MIKTGLAIIGGLIFLVVGYEGVTIIRAYVENRL
jgi:hypothetical protein